MLRSRRFPRFIRFVVSSTAALVALGSSAGCQRMPAHGSRDQNSAWTLWEGPAKELFDDNIEPAALGMNIDGGSPYADRQLRDRARKADVVARVRVNTVTVDSIGDESLYHLSIQVGSPPFSKPRLPDDHFELTIRATSPSFSVVKALDSRLHGRTFIGFLQRFASVDGEPVIHWHLSPDTAEVAAAVQDALLLGEIVGH